MFPLATFRHFKYYSFNKRCFKLTAFILQSEYEALNYPECKLSQKSIDDIISANENCEKITSDRISHFHSNQVGVNRPVEDRWNAGSFNLSNLKSSSNVNPYNLGHIFSVVDGHNGHACSHTINYCHMDYIAVAMIKDVDVLEEFLNNLNENEYLTLTKSLVHHNTWGTMATSVRESHFRNLRAYISDIIKNFDDGNKSRSSALRSSLCRLDQDMITAASPNSNFINRALLRTVTSGCVGTFIYVPETDTDVYIAQVGDCGAVLGSLDSVTNNWSAELLVKPHNSSNPSEIERIEGEHPISESNSVIREDRLLGELMPLRAFGDVKFKWSTNTLKTTAALLGLSPSYPVTPQFYFSPPYLTSEPEIKKFHVDKNSDKFLIIASDGLWDKLTPKEAVDTVAKCWKEQILKIKNTNEDYCVGENTASVLIKTALSGSDTDYEKLSLLLSMPGNIGRYYRDDITVIVLFFK